MPDEDGFPGKDAFLQQLAAARSRTAEGDVALARLYPHVVGGPRAVRLAVLDALELDPRLGQTVHGRPSLLPGGLLPGSLAPGLQLSRGHL